MRPRFSLFILILLLPGLASRANAQEAFVPMEGAIDPDTWSLSGGNGKVVEGGILEVTGTGNDSNYWRHDVTFQPRKVYRFSAKVRHLDGTGGIITGPAFANRDHRVGSEWTTVEHFFRVPDDVERSYLRLGQWHATGRVQFAEVDLQPALPIHRKVGKIIFGHGERIADGKYYFRSDFGYSGSNNSRHLLSTNARFNSNRWTLGSNQEIVYAFGNVAKFTEAKLSMTVGYHQRGALIAEALILENGKMEYVKLGELDHLGSSEMEFPKEILPIDVFHLRFRTEEKANLQLYDFSLEAELEKHPSIFQESLSSGTLQGETIFATIKGDLPVHVFQGTFSVNRNRGMVDFEFLLGNPTETSRSLSVGLWKGSRENAENAVPKLDRELAIEPDATFEEIVSVQPTSFVAVPPSISWSTPLDRKKHYRVVLEGKDSGKRKVVSFDYNLPDLFRTDYGRRIVDTGSDLPVWWCPAAHKVPRNRVLPETASGAAMMSAARNDYEAVQVIVRPEKKLEDLMVEVTDLKGPEGVVLGQEHLEVLQVAYHFVERPTDQTSVVGWWPDALPPWDRPVEVAAGENQPIWLLVHVPEGVPAGDYHGALKLTSKEKTSRVPVSLHVWDFTLPRKNHLATAFGLSTGNIFRYHGLSKEEDRRKVVDAYLASFAEHRISPYDPVPLDPYRVEFVVDEQSPEKSHAKLDFSQFDAAMERVLEKYPFTDFRLRLQGMGGGTFHARYEPEIQEFGKETPEYQAMFGDYLGKLQSHLIEKGWIEMPYTYWFDEPAPKDYAFVRNGMERIKRYAPGLRTMITEQPGEESLGPIDIWCPVLHNYDHQRAEALRKEGDEFWWYVCTGPKAPYCGLFLDHPAVELRSWLWQTWKHDVVGILVWQSNYWNSTAAFPEGAQNPYEDPMSYVSGYSTPEGTKRFWGNGDGRFIYPPRRAATPSDEPVLDGPVSSIRWEMLREGIEDYEMLHRLRELLREKGEKIPPKQRKAYEKLLEVPDSITEELTSFSKHPGPIYAHRVKVATAIEDLERMK